LEIAGQIAGGVANERHYKIVEGGDRHLADLSRLARPTVLVDDLDKADFALDMMGARHRTLQCD
jgi:hypothetical protein